MVAAGLWLLRLMAILTAVSVVAVGISVALVASVRAAEPGVERDAGASGLASHGFSARAW